MTLERQSERSAVVDLVGLLAYAELTAFDRLVDDARLAPGLEDRAALAGMAVAEFGHYQRLHDHLEKDLGVPAEEAMTPFVAVLDAFHESTAPADWLEGLVKAYVGDGMAVDFYREVAQRVDEPTRSLVLDVLADTGHAGFAVEHVRTAISVEPALAGRLALWARRLVGEALTQAYRVAAERESLTRLIIGPDDATSDLAEIGRMLTRLTENHAARMAALGLQA
ncbi:MAG: ferritin-like fold-containing protein [Actinomycetes bacterium]